MGARSGEGPTNLRVMSEKTAFVHLHSHTEYSLLDGLCRVKDLVAATADRGMPAAAITDHGNLFGAHDFYKACQAKGIKPIIGCEAYISKGSMAVKRPTARGERENNHFVLLATNETGYRNLVRLVSRAHTEGMYYKPRIDKDLLSRHAEGLIGMSACLAGELAETCVRANDLGKAERVAREYAEIFGPDNFYLELENHGIREQKQALEGVLEVHRKTGLPLVATNDSHYLAKEHADAHDLMMCIGTGKKVADTNRLRYDQHEFYLKTPQEMWQLFGHWPEALRNTLLIAERCDLTLDLGQHASHFPKFNADPGFDDLAYLTRLGAEGVRKRYGVEDVAKPKDEREKEIADRFFFELEVIQRTNYVNYFLVVSDFVQHAKREGVPVGPGRGSGAGSLLAYVLEITDLDPLRFGLYFERFLNPERVSPPDFDIDFCQRRRGEVIQYVKQRYGRENTAQIITFGSMGAKSVIRDVARVLDIPLPVADRIAKAVPEGPDVTLAKALEKSPDFRQIATTDPDAKRIMEYAPVLEGLPRNPGTHAAGVVIGERPLDEIVPMTLDKDKGEPQTQWQMKQVEDAGLLKMDFLGLKTLTVIQDAVDHVRNTRGVEVDIGLADYDDAATYQLLARGDTVGVFQLESGGMQDLLRKMEISTFEELMAIIALYRPGPMGMIPDYVARKKGEVPIAYDHPLLEDVLKETYGIFVYQEQVQKAANVLAGFSLGEGDVLRRAMGKKNPVEMEGQRAKFVEGCVRNGIPKARAAQIFDLIAKFAEYGFNKSHTAAYAVVAYQTAYLKAHYPVEFMAALLTSEMDRPDKLAKFLAATQAMRIEIQPPDVNASGRYFTPDGAAIRFGMAGIKGVGGSAVDAIVAEREAQGPYAGLADFCLRIEAPTVNKKCLESLIRAGAFDFTGLSRGRLFEGLETVMTHAASRRRERQSGQSLLFDLLSPEDGGETGTPRDDDILPEAPAWPTAQMLREEKDLLGFFVSGHPLDSFRWELEKLQSHGLSELTDLEHDTPVTVGGMVKGFRKLFTRKTGEAMAAFALEGLETQVDAVAFPAAFKQCGVYLVDDARLMLTGRWQREEGFSGKVIVDKAVPLDRAAELITDRLRLRLPPVASEAEAAPILRSLHETSLHYPGSVRILIEIPLPQDLVVLDAAESCGVKVTRELIVRLEELLGPDGVAVRPKKPEDLAGRNGPRNGPRARPLTRADR